MSSSPSNQHRASPPHLLGSGYVAAGAAAREHSNPPAAPAPALLSAHDKLRKVVNTIRFTRRLQLRGIRGIAQISALRYRAIRARERLLRQQGSTNLSSEESTTPKHSPGGLQEAAAALLAAKKLKSSNDGGGGKDGDFDDDSSDDEPRPFLNRRIHLNQQWRNEITDMISSRSSSNNNTKSKESGGGASDADSSSPLMPTHSPSAPLGATSPPFSSSKEERKDNVEQSGSGGSSPTNKYGSSGNSDISTARVVGLHVGLLVFNLYEACLIRLCNHVDTYGRIACDAPDATFVSIFHQQQKQKRQQKQDAEEDSDDRDGEIREEKEDPGKVGTYGAGDEDDELDYVHSINVPIGAVVAAWLGGFLFGFSIFNGVFIIGCCGIFVAWYRRQTEAWDRLREALLIIAHLGQSQEVCSSVCSLSLRAPWVRFPPAGHAERGEWFDRLVGNLWSGISTATTNSIVACMDPIFERCCPGFLSDLKCGPCQVGMEPMRFVSAQTTLVDEESGGGIALTFDVAWRSSCDISVIASTSVVDMEVHLKALTLQGQLRCVLGPPCDQWPCAYAVNLSFLGAPDLDFDLSAVKINLDAIPGLAAWLDNFTRATIVNLMVSPKRMVCPITTVPKSIMDTLQATTLPQGIVVCEVHRAEGLRGELIGGAPTTYVKGKLLPEMGGDAGGGDSGHSYRDGQITCTVDDEYDPKYKLGNAKGYIGQAYDAFVSWMYPPSATGNGGEATGGAEAGGGGASDPMNQSYAGKMLNTFMKQRFFAGQNPAEYTFSFPTYGVPKERILLTVHNTEKRLSKDNAIAYYEMPIRSIIYGEASLAKRRVSQYPDIDPESLCAYDIAAMDDQAKTECVTLQKWRGDPAQTAFKFIDPKTRRGKQGAEDVNGKLYVLMRYYPLVSLGRYPELLEAVAMPEGAIMADPTSTLTSASSQNNNAPTLHQEGAEDGGIKSMPVPRTHRFRVPGMINLQIASLERIFMRKAPPQYSAIYLCIRIVPRPTDINHYVPPTKHLRRPKETDQRTEDPDTVNRAKNPNNGSCPIAREFIRSPNGWAYRPKPEELHEIVLREAAKLEAEMADFHQGFHSHSSHSQHQHHHHNTGGGYGHNPHNATSQQSADGWIDDIHSPTLYSPGNKSFKNKIRKEKHFQQQKKWLQDQKKNAISGGGRGGGENTPSKKNNGGKGGGGDNMQQQAANNNDTRFPMKDINYSYYSTLWFEDVHTQALEVSAWCSESGSDPLFGWNVIPLRYLADLCVEEFAIAHAQQQKDVDEKRKRRHRHRRAGRGSSSSDSSQSSSESDSNSDGDEKKEEEEEGTRSLQNDGVAEELCALRPVYGSGGSVLLKAQLLTRSGLLPEGIASGTSSSAETASSSNPSATADGNNSDLAQEDSLMAYNPNAAGGVGGSGGSNGLNRTTTQDTLAAMRAADGSSNGEGGGSSVYGPKNNLGIAILARYGDGDRGGGDRDGDVQQDEKDKGSKESAATTSTSTSTTSLLGSSQNPLLAAIRLLHSPASTPSSYSSSSHKVHVPVGLRSKLMASGGRCHFYSLQHLLQRFVPRAPALLSSSVPSGGGAGGSSSPQTAAGMLGATASSSGAGGGGTGTTTFSIPRRRLVIPCYVATDVTAQKGNGLFGRLGKALTSEHKLQERYHDQLLHRSLFTSAGSNPGSTGGTGTQHQATTTSFDQYVPQHMIQKAVFPKSSTSSASQLLHSSTTNSNNTASAAAATSDDSSLHNVVFKERILVIETNGQGWQLRITKINDDSHTQKQHRSQQFDIAANHNNNNASSNQQMNATTNGGRRSGSAAGAATTSNSSTTMAASSPTMGAHRNLLLNQTHDKTTIASAALLSQLRLITSSSASSTSISSSSSVLQPVVGSSSATNGSGGAGAGGAAQLMDHHTSSSTHQNQNILQSHHNNATNERSYQSLVSEGGHSIAVQCRGVELPLAHPAPPLPTSLTPDAIRKMISAGGLLPPPPPPSTTTTATTATSSSTNNNTAVAGAGGNFRFPGGPGPGGVGAAGSGSGSPSQPPGGSTLSASPVPSNPNPSNNYSASNSHPPNAQQLNAMTANVVRGINHSHTVHQFVDDSNNNHKNKNSSSSSKHSGDERDFLYNNAPGEFISMRVATYDGAVYFPGGGGGGGDGSGSVSGSADGGSQLHYFWLEFFCPFSRSIGKEVSNSNSNSNSNNTNGNSIASSTGGGGSQQRRRSSSFGSGSSFGTLIRQSSSDGGSGPGPLHGVSATRQAFRCLKSVLESQSVVAGCCRQLQQNRLRYQTGGDVSTEDGGAAARESPPSSNGASSSSLYISPSEQYRSLAQGLIQQQSSSSTAPSSTSHNNNTVFVTVAINNRTITHHHHHQGGSRRGSASASASAAVGGGGSGGSAPETAELDGTFFLYDCTVRLTSDCGVDMGSHNSSGGGDGGSSSSSSSLSGFTAAVSQNATHPPLLTFEGRRRPGQWIGLAKKIAQKRDSSSSSNSNNNNNENDDEDNANFFFEAEHDAGVPPPPEVLTLHCLYCDGNYRTLQQQQQQQQHHNNTGTSSTGTTSAGGTTHSAGGTGFMASPFYLYMSVARRDRIVVPVFVFDCNFASLSNLIRSQHFYSPATTGSGSGSGAGSGAGGGGPPRNSKLMEEDESKFWYNFRCMPIPKYLSSFRFHRPSAQHGGAGATTATGSSPRAPSSPPSKTATAGTVGTVGSRGAQPQQPTPMPVDSLSVLRRSISDVMMIMLQWQESVTSVVNYA